GLVGSAAFAWPEAGPFGFLARRVEVDVFSSRRPGRTRRAAIDPRRPHRIVKAAVGARITAQHGSPALFIIRKWRQLRHERAPPRFRCTVRLGRLIVGDSMSTSTPLLALKS